MHDLFDIVGLSRSAPPVEVRRACARLVRRAHPDFGVWADSAAPRTSSDRPRRPLAVQRDVAVDFVEIAAVLDGIQSSFFSTPIPGDC